MTQIKDIQILKEKTGWTRNIPVKNNDKVNFIQVYAHYHKNKASYIGDKNRGYYMSISPIKIENRNGYSIATGSPYDGSLYFIRSTDKYKPKEANAIFEECMNDTHLIEGWIKEHGYEIE